MDNISVNEKEKEIKIMLNTLFYPEECILRTLEKFKDICWVGLSGDPKGCMFVSLRPKNENTDYKNLGLEFMNHLLAEIKELEGS